MEFKTLRNIENSFRQIRLYAIVFAVLCIGVVGFAVWKSYSFANEQRQKIYVLDNGKSLMLALSQDASINRPVEAREHVRRFHELFLRLHLIRMLSRAIWQGHSTLPTNQPLTITKTYRRKVITPVSYRGMFSNALRSIVSCATSTTIPIRCGRMRSNLSYGRVT